jgi:hypothetical protein
MFFEARNLKTIFIMDFPIPILWYSGTTPNLLIYAVLLSRSFILIVPTAILSISAIKTVFVSMSFSISP